MVDPQVTFRLHPPSTEIVFDDGMWFECPADNLLNTHDPRIHFRMWNVSQTNLRFDLARPVWIHILRERNLKKRQKERKELEQMTKAWRM